MEEIVGEIEDEHDIAEVDFVKNKDGSLTIDGDFAIRDANREFDWSLPDYESVTLAGILVETAQKIPEVGESIEINGVEFTILSRKKQVITKVKAKVLSDVSTA